MNLTKQQRKRNRTLAFCLGLLLSGTPILSFAVSIPTVQAQTVPSEVRRGYTELGQGLVNQAIATFRGAIQRYPESLEAKLGLAIAFRRAGRDADAFQAYQQVLVQDPNNVLALKTIGILGGFRTEWQARGIEALTTLLKISPADNEARAQRGLLYGFQGRFAESLADYEIALQGSPTPDVLLGAAQIYTYGGNPQKGLELFERYRSASNKPIVGNAAIAYARALRATGNTAQAIRILEGQLPRETNAFGVQVRSELSQAYLANRQPTQALAILDPLRDRGDSRLSLARALNEIGKQENRPDLSAQASDLYRQVLNSTPNPSPALVREVADVLSAIPQDRQTALQLYRQLVQQQPSDKVLIIQQLALESQLGTLPQAEVRQRLRSILQPLPSSPAQQAAIAQALVRLEPDPEFLPVYQSLIQAGVNEPFLNFRLAQLLIERNDLDGAKTALAAYQATSVGSRDLAPELLLAELDRRQGNLEASAKRYETLISSSSRDSDVTTAAIRGLAGIRLAQARYEDALTLYDQLISRSPQDQQLQLGRAAIAYQGKKITETEAEAVIDRLLQARPAETPQELYTLVGLLPSNPRREALYNALIEADPSNVTVQVRLIQLLAVRSPNQARAQANRLIARVRKASPNGNNNVELLFLKGQLEQALGNLDRAEDAFAAIVNLEPDNTNALSALGGIRFQQRQFDSAASLYSQVLELNPDDLIAQRSLAELTAAQGNPLEALERFEQLQVQGNADPNLSRRIQQLQEDMLRQRGFQPPWERY
ncbi:tetratricopeptide repeat protein [Phormidesmis sp. 146-33]